MLHKTRTYFVIYILLPEVDTLSLWPFISIITCCLVPHKDTRCVTYSDRNDSLCLTRHLA